jgi:hypothetical protein
MTRSSPQPSAWGLEKLAQAARRTVDARRRPATSVASPPTVTTQPRQQDVVVLGIVNFGRTREGLPPLAKLPEFGPEQPHVEPIDAVKLAAAIVEAGPVARAELPIPLPADPVARAIVVAGERAAGRAAARASVVKVATYAAPSESNDQRVRGSKRSQDLVRDIWPWNPCNPTSRRPCERKLLG